ncbi:alpha-2-macroglobulin, partial [bacterium]
MNIILLFGLLFGWGLCAGPVYAVDPSIEFFSPQGEVKGVRQVTVRFSEAMVPFGDPTLVDPFDIRCAQKGRGRWADGRNWVYDFERDLPAGVACEFIVKSDLKTLTGEKTSGQKNFAFHTGGPAVKQSNPHEGSQVDEEQVFILALDAEAKENTVLEHAYCAVEGINERIGIGIIKGEKRDRLLKSQGQHYRFGFSREGAKEHSIVVLQCKQRFPNGAKVRLVWGRSIESLSGVATSRDQNLTYQVRDPFRATFACDRENAKADCIPLLPFHIQFSAPVAREYALAVALKGQNHQVHKPILQQSDENEADPARQPAFVQGVRFNGPFPPLASFTLELPKGMKDDAGRLLANRGQFPLTVKTADYPPLAKFASRFGIIERADPFLPVTLRNIEAEVKAKMLEVVVAKTMVKKIEERVADAVNKIISGQVTGKVKTFKTDADISFWLNRVSEADSKRSVFEETQEKASARVFAIPKPNGPKAFEVIGIPLKAPGFYVVELESKILGQSLFGEPKPYYASAAALVTNLAAHFKQSRESSLVWVTRLDNTEPVKGASVSIRDCEGKVHWEGKTDEQGLARINRKLPQEDQLPQCRNYRMGGYYVFARTDDDMTFVRSKWDQGIEAWRFNLPQDSYQGPVIAHTILDRSLLRAGETIFMKHVVRQHTMSGFSLLKSLPQVVEIQHQGSDERYEYPLVWDARGIAETSWKIPNDAKRGTYTITLLKKAAGKTQRRPSAGGDEGDGENASGWQSGSFRVEEFRVPLMKGIVQPPKEPLVNVREATVDVFVSYLSGGGASGASVKLRTLVSPRQVWFQQYENFQFANGRVKEGITSREQRRYDDDDHGEDESEDVPTRERKKPVHASSRTQDVVLDATGAARTTITDLPRGAAPQNIQTEIEFRDPNGEVQTVSSRIPLWSSKLLVGIEPDAWVATRDAFKFHVLVVDLSGKPMQGRSVTAELFERKMYSHRKRLLGGFYAYEHATEIKKVARICDGKTDAKGLLICESRSPVSGNVIIQARVHDDDANESVAHRDIWIADKGEWWFQVSDNDRIDLLPEQKHYEPGDTARFQVRMPFREATALVTVEREGIMETFIKKLSGKMPMIEVPIKGNFAPNVFVSVLCLRGRVGDIKPTTLVDLGRPAYKLGIAEINVGWRAHELRVSLTPEHKVYRIRDKAKVAIKVSQWDERNSRPPRSAEVAVAAVDEGLLELMPNKSWNLLDAMMGRRGYEVHTSTAQMQVVGKRHYGLKAFPQGGGGGRQTTREMFDTLLLWKGRVNLNDKGEATIEIPLNDSLTSFRIAAIANAEAGLFGSGETSIRTTQDLMLLSGLPPVLREGDRFRAGFTLRNASDRKMDVGVSAHISGASIKLEPRNESLGPGEARELFWNVAIPLNIESLEWEVSAKEANGTPADKLKIKQKIIEAIPTRVFQASVMQLDKPHSLTVAKPINAVPGKGGVNLSFRKKLSHGLGGVTWYMKNYPYTCMEQKISRAIALRDEALWKQLTAELPAHLDSEGLVKYFPTCHLGSDCLTAFILSITDEAGWEIPADLKERMLSGLRG